MANINDYLKWRKDIKIAKKTPFNELDQLILARFSYLPFHRINLEKVETISSIAQKMQKLPKNSYCWPDDQEFLRLLGKSRRFSEMKVTNYVKNNSRELERQFSAVTIHLDFMHCYLSYFGTDDSITGWKEDFNLAFLEEIPAQKEALEYLRNRAKHFFWKRIYLGGHSKGGNIATYAAIKSSDVIQKRISGVYNYDGPGLSSSLVKQDTGDFKILNKIQSFVPQESIIGRLFEHKEAVVVVHSEAKNIFQHDIYSWQVETDRFARSKYTKKSDLINKAVNKWIQSASRSEFETFVNGMFVIFSSAEVNNPIELMRKWRHFAPKLLKEYLNTPREKKKVIAEVWRKLGESLIHSQIEQSGTFDKINKLFKKQPK